MSKYKLKSSSSICKRFKITAKGKLLRHKACHNHLLQKKTSQHKQSLRRVEKLKQVDFMALRSKIF